MRTAEIRREADTDHGAVRELIVEVFREAFGTGEEEAHLVEDLRDLSEWGPGLSLVAEIEGVLVGHVMFSGVRIDEQPDVPACTLAPLGVYRKYQGRGVGSQLVEQGLGMCRELGYKVVFVQGSMEFYPRFGFVPIVQTRLHTVFKSDHDMVMGFGEGRLEALSGRVAFPKPWHVFL